MTSDLTFIHLTDLHLFADEEQEFWGQRPAQKFRKILARIRDMEIVPDFFIVSGDLADRGDSAEYQKFNSLLADMRTFGVPIILGLGNHDRRVPFRQTVLGEAITDESIRYYHSTLIHGLRVIMLDSKVSGEVLGTVDAAQLAWLAEELRTPAPLGTVIAIHHPPVMSTVEQQNVHILQNPHELAAVIAGHQIHAILSGHIHYAHITTFHGILSVATPATFYTLNPGVQQALSATDGSGFTLCSLRNGQFYANPIMMEKEIELYRHAPPPPIALPETSITS